MCDTNIFDLFSYLFVHIYRPSFTERPYLYDLLPARIGQYEYSTPASFYSYLRIRGLREVTLQQVRSIFFRTTGLLDNLTHWPTIIRAYFDCGRPTILQAYNLTALDPCRPTPLRYCTILHPLRTYWPTFYKPTSRPTVLRKAYYLYHRIFQLTIGPSLQPFLRYP